MKIRKIGYTLKVRGSKFVKFIDLICVTNINSRFCTRFFECPDPSMAPIRRVSQFFDIPDFSTNYNKIRFANFSLFYCPYFSTVPFARWPRSTDHWPHFLSQNLPILSLMVLKYFFNWFILYYIPFRVKYTNSKNRDSRKNTIYCPC